MNLKSKDYIYWNRDTIIIYSKINKPINLNLLNKNFTRVVFSNYKYIRLFFSNNNIYNSANHNEWKPQFNSKLVLPNKITHLTLGYCFNCPINLTNNIQLTHLTFGNNFNQPINLSNNIQLTHLTFGNNFNQPIELVENLIELNFGVYFDHPIKLPNKLTHLSFGIFFDQPIELVKSLTHIRFGTLFNQPIILPKNIQSISFGTYFDQPINFPKSLIQLHLGVSFSQSVNPIELANLKYFEINCNNLSLVENLPNSLEKLIIGSCANFPLNNLPNSIKFIMILNEDYNEDLSNLPNSIEHIVLNSKYDKLIPIQSIGKNLKLIECSSQYKYLDLLKKSNIPVKTYNLN